MQGLPWRGHVRRRGKFDDLPGRHGRGTVPGTAEPVPTGKAGRRREVTATSVRPRPGEAAGAAGIASAGP